MGIEISTKKNKLFSKKGLQFLVYRVTLFTDEKQ